MRPPRNKLNWGKTPNRAPLEAKIRVDCGRAIWEAVDDGVLSRKIRNPLYSDLCGGTCDLRPE